MKDLIEKVEAWAEDRGIFENSDAQTQALKFLSEFGELCDAIAKGDQDGIVDGVGDTLVTLILLSRMVGSTFDECLQHKNMDEYVMWNAGTPKLMALAIGCIAGTLAFDVFEGHAPLWGICRIVVHLDGLAQACGTSLEEGLAAAYKVISKRTGKMVNGVFVKDKP